MKTLKAGALQLVTFVIVVIAILLASFILLMHMHKQFRIRTNHTIEAVALVDRGISEVLNADTYNDTIMVDLHDEDYKSLKTHSGFWGVYDKVYAEAKIKNKTLNKAALVGTTLDHNTAPTLYLKDNNKPLVLVGQTTIKGNAVLPKRGVKSGTIAGQSYYGEQYIYGQTSLSKDLPKLNGALVKHLEDLKVGNFKIQDINYINLRDSKIYQNSFDQTLQLAYSESDIFLSDITITGHIAIQSSTKITVDSSAKLQDVLLVAPVIDIKQNVKGNFQTFATQRISIGEDVNLKYPSALILQKDYDKNETKTSSRISIADHSKISGQIVMLGETQSNNYDAQIKISPNAIVEGNIYCEQNLELRGTVYGSVYTDNFIIKEGGSVFQNHLFNAVIDGGKLSSEFIGLNLEKAQKGIAKWLY